MGWAHLPKPASGIPAGGEGLWGAARSVKGDTRPDFSADTQPPAALKSAGHMEAKEYREELRKRRAKGLRVIDKVLDAADAEGADLAALVAGVKVVEMIDNRIDGKANQSVSGPEGGPIPTTMTVAFVKSNARDPEG